MRRKGLLGTLFGIALVFVMIGGVVGGLVSTGNAIASSSGVYADSSYDRQAATSYATAYAYRTCDCGKYYGSSPPPQGSGTQLTTSGGDCAHFVSHCLAAGGLSNKGTKYARGWCEGGAKDYIITVHETRDWFNETGIATKVSSVNLLEPGDVIVTYNYGHVVLYIGTYGGKTHQVASHSAWGIFSYTYFGTPNEYWHIASSSAPCTAKFTSGDIVQVNTPGSCLLCYSGGPTSGTSKCEPHGTVGVILDPTPTRAAGYCRVKVRYCDGFEGWSAQEYLEGKYIAPSTKFSIGETVRVTSSVGVKYRSDPPELNELGAVPQGTEGEILAGPKYGAVKDVSGCYWFWKVDYGAGKVGWSAEDYLEKVTPCPYSCWDRSALSGNELAALVRSHFPLGVTQTDESIRVTAYAVAKAESEGGNPSACGDIDIPYPGHLSIGLWQINTYWHPEYDRCRLFEEDYNANAAKEISNNGNNWNPWSAWKNGSYTEYLTEARKHFYPKVTSLSVSQASINLGEAVTIYYSVSDDVGLARVELWRTTDKNGAPDEPNWAKVPGKEVSISGTTYSGYFTDTPTSPGIYWYGIHVADNSGAPKAWNDEKNSRTGGSPGVFGPKKVEVTQEQCGGTDTSCGIWPNCENCNVYDDCYAYDSGCEERNYYCYSNEVGCIYTHSNRHTDYYGDWEYYCKGDQVWKRRLFHNFYCDGGSCKDHPSWDEQLVEDCNTQDGWVDTGETNWVTTQDYECKLDQKEQKEQEYRDYTCSGGSCVYSVTNTQWVDTGNTQTINKPDGTECGTDYYDGWVNYCKGDELWKHRQFHDFSCEAGTCTDHPSWDEQLVEDCNSYDGWVDTGETNWIDDAEDPCREIEQKEQEYWDYYCDSGSCAYEATDTRWVDTGNYRVKEFTLTIAVNGTGTTDPTPGSHTYDCCTAVHITAIETDPGSQFDHWSGTDNDAINPTTVTMNSNKSVTAYFTAGVSPPTVSTGTPSSVEETTATSQGDIISTGGENCDKRGVCWSMSPDPDITDGNFEESGSFGTGPFTASISGVSKGTRYYARAYAHNSAGYGYGDNVTFTTKPDEPTGFTATTAGTRQIDLSWTKGAGAEKTTIRRSTSSHPAGPGEGDPVYFDTGTSKPDTGLASDTDYYYSAWSWVEGSDIWSDTYDTAYARTAPPQAPSDLIITQKCEQWVDPQARTYTITYGICNSGGQDAGASSTAVFIDAVDTLHDSVPPLAPDECYYNTVGPFTMSGDGDTINICADCGEAVDESDETNNCRENTFQYQEDEQIQIALKAGWNMVSVPVVPDDTSVSAVFPGAEAVYTWDPATKSYYMPTDVEPHKGYWVAVTADTDITVTGAIVSNWTSSLTAGWNMIGSIYGKDVDFSDPDDVPDGSVEAPAYWWNPSTRSYDLVYTLETKNGHWAAATQNCQLTVS